MGKWGLGFACATALASILLPVGAQTPPVEAVAREACPPPVKHAPVYPIDMMRRGKGGTVLLALDIDACGKVKHVVVKQSSGQKQLDDAAVTATTQWVLDPVARAKAVAGTVELPVSFGMSPDQAIPYAELSWPKSHKRPQYRLEPMPEFGSADAAVQAIGVPIKKVIKPPYPGIQSQFFRHGDGAVPEYWLFLYKGRSPNLAARYRLTYDGTQPTVVLSIACDDQPEACANASNFLMKGLPFARAK